MRPLPGRLVLLGHPVSHSLSPLFQNAALRHAGVPLVYEPLDVAPEELDVTLDALERTRAAGNVTVPHKTRVAARCGHLTPLAERAGAVNSFRVSDDGVLEGENTDVGGFDALVRHAMGELPVGIHIALLGAGGGARAVLAAVERWRACTVSVYARRAAPAAALAERFPIITDVHDEVRRAVGKAALIVNATPVGMSEDHRHPAPLDVMDPGATILDLVYRRGETAWVRAARARGHRAADGLVLLLEQGALAFEHWLGIPAPRDVMRGALA